MGVLAVMYRLVGPDAYGLFFMVVPLLLLSRLMPTQGWHAALVQRATLPDEAAQALFRRNLASGTWATALVIGVTPLWAWMYGQPELWKLVPALGGTTLVATLGSFHLALLERDVRLSQLAGTRLVAQVAGGATAILTALWRRDVWALVAGQYVEFAALAVLGWRLHSWRPARISTTADIQGSQSFARFFALSGLTTFLTNNVDKIIVGVWAGERALGLYSQAFNFMLKPVYLLTTPLTSMVLSSLSRTQPGEDEFLRFASGFYRFVAALLIPAGVGLFFVGQDVMLVLGGNEWATAGVLLSCLALAIPAHGMVILSGYALAASGRSDRQFWASGISAGILLTVYLAIWGWSVFTEPSVTQALITLSQVYALVWITLIVGLWYVAIRNATGVGFAELRRAATQPLLASALMASGLYVARNTVLLNVSPLVRLIACVALGGALYLACSYSQIVELRRWWRSAAITQAT